MHCVWTLADGDADFALRWKVIKRVAWESRVEKASPFSTLRNVDTSAEWVNEMT